MNWWWWWWCAGWVLGVEKDLPKIPEVQRMIERARAEEREALKNQVPEVAKASPVPKAPDQPAQAPPVAKTAAPSPLPPPQQTDPSPLQTAKAEVAAARVLALATGSSEEDKRKLETMLKDAAAEAITTANASALAGLLSSVLGATSLGGMETSQENQEPEPDPFALPPGQIPSEELSQRGEVRCCETFVLHVHSLTTFVATIDFIPPAKRFWAP